MLQRMSEPNFRSLACTQRMSGPKLATYYLSIDGSGPFIGNQPFRSLAYTQRMSEPNFRSSIDLRAPTSSHRRSCIPGLWFLPRQQDPTALFESDLVHPPSRGAHAPHCLLRSFVLAPASPRDHVVPGSGFLPRVRVRVDLLVSHRSSSLVRSPRSQGTSYAGRRTTSRSCSAPRRSSSAFSNTADGTIPTHTPGHW
jgi:hypothetical protein